MCLKKNEGALDRAVRAVIALVAFILAMFTTGALSTTLYVVAIVLFITAIIGYCGLYHIFGIHTLHEVKKEEPKTIVKAAVKAKPKSKPKKKR